MENMRKVINYLREDAHSRLGIPLMLVGWLTVAGVVIAIGNFNPQHWSDAWQTTKQDVMWNYFRID